MNRLPIVDFKGKKFFFDKRLMQLRNVNNPHEFFDLCEIETAMFDEVVR